MSLTAHVNTLDATQANPSADAQTLPLSAIHKRDQHNPRRIRSKKAWAELKESIAEKGVLQSILVRPHPDMPGDYELVAGETRYDIANELGLTEIPANVRHLSDEELLDYATTENVKRAAMSTIDEGRAAQALMAEGKSRDEVCRLMGWKPAFLDSRIQLTHCCDEVAQALCDESITIGHAQLLSSLRHAAQEKALALVIERKITVEQLRAIIDNMSLKLATACFPTEDCQTCPHNSSTQASLFADSTTLSKARCLNKECFDSKTQAHLDAVKADLAESSHKVAFVSEVPAGTTAIIVASGTHGVGEEQATACAGCEHYGATINDTHGAKAAVTHQVCFNVACHTKKVADHRKLIATDAAPATPSDQTAQASAKSNAQPDSATTETRKPEAQEKPKAKAKTSVAKSAIPASVVDKHHAIHRQAAAAKISQDAKAALIVSLLCMMSEAGVKPDRVPEGWPPFLSGENRAKAAALLDTLSLDQLQKLQQLLAAKLIENAKRGDGTNEKDGYGSLALWVATSRKVDLTAHWTMDSDYLQPFTKPMIAQRLEESGFADQYNAEHGEKAFKKLAGGKKGDLLDAVKDSNFDFSGYLPEGLKLPHSDEVKAQSKTETPKATGDDATSKSEAA